MSQQNSADWVADVFDRFLPDATIARITSNYPDYRDAPLAQLGVDSMSIMGLVLKMQSVYDITIDFASFDIAILATLGSMEDYLTSLGVLPAAAERRT